MKAIKDMGLPLSANVRLLMGTDEESGSGDIAYYYSKHPFAPYTFTPDADFPVIHIEKGHYHPDFGRSWTAESALPRVTGMNGGFRTNVVPPEAECVVAGLTAAQVESLAGQVAAETHTPFTLTDKEEGLHIHCAGKECPRRLSRRRPQRHLRPSGPALPPAPGRVREHRDPACPPHPLPLWG